MGILGGIGTALAGSGAAATDQRRTRFYALEQFFLKNGNQVPAIHDYLGKTAIPAMKRAYGGPILALEALVAPHMPQAALIAGFSSLDEMWTTHAKAIADRAFAEKALAWESGPEAPFETQSATLLEAADYSPEIAVSSEPRKSPRIFELRVYHSPTGHQLRALHERFSGAEVKIFHRSGIHPLLYSSTVFGASIPNLTYVIPFDSLSDREKAWAAFGADPEWTKVRAESIAEHGQISSVIQISLFKAAPYSPVQ